MLDSVARCVISQPCSSPLKPQRILMGVSSCRFAHIGGHAPQARRPGLLCASAGNTHGPEVCTRVYLLATSQHIRVACFLYHIRSIQSDWTRTGLKEPSRFCACMDGLKLCVAVGSFMDCYFFCDASLKLVHLQKHQRARLDIS